MRSMTDAVAARTLNVCQLKIVNKESVMNIWQRCKVDGMRSLLHVTQGENNGVVEGEGNTTKIQPLHLG